MTGVESSRVIGVKASRVIGVEASRVIGVESSRVVLNIIGIDRSCSRVKNVIPVSVSFYVSVRICVSRHLIKYPSACPLLLHVHAFSGGNRFYLNLI